MARSLERAIYEVSLRMRLTKAVQDFKTTSGTEKLTEREILLLELLNERKGMSVLEVASFFPGTAESTISAALMRLWKRPRPHLQGHRYGKPQGTGCGAVRQGQKALQGIKRNSDARFGLLLEAISVTPKERTVIEEVLERALGYLDQRLGTVTKSPS